MRKLILSVAALSCPVTLASLAHADGYSSWQKAREVCDKQLATQGKTGDKK